MTGKYEHRPQNPAASCLHPRNALYAGAPEQIEEQRFRIVVHVMGNEDIIITFLRKQIHEPCIPELPSGHLYRKRLFPGVPDSIETDAVKRE